MVALAGNPNTGKSTVFNALTGLRQHTGNWPGKTVTRAEGGFASGGKRYKLVDLPGTYSLLSASLDEEVARDFLLFGQPDVTVVVVDATRLERNLNLVLQVLEITNRAVVCLNLMDEARRRGIEVDPRRLARDLGVRVVPTSARHGEGLPELMQAIAEVASGREWRAAASRWSERSPALQRAVGARQRGRAGPPIPSCPTPRWVALRLLDGDERIIEAVRAGELGDLGQRRRRRCPACRPPANARPSSEPRRTPCWSWPRSCAGRSATEFHQSLMEAVYTEAARIADRAVTRAAAGRRVRSRSHHRPAGDQPRLGRAADARDADRRLLADHRRRQRASAHAGHAAHRLDASGAASRAPPAIGAPWWLVGLLIDGMYLATAWVVSVMLPPMAIFFPLFTLLEDFGYLPRVAFNLDRPFRRAGAHGKQALTWRWAGAATPPAWWRRASSRARASG